MIVLVTCKNEVDLIKNEFARVVNYFLRRSMASNSVVVDGSGQNLNSSKLLLLSLLHARIKIPNQN